MDIGAEIGIALMNIYDTRVALTAGEAKREKALASFVQDGHDHFVSVTQNPEYLKRSIHY